MSRYYSQSYAQLDDPDWQPERSTEDLDESSYEPYRSQYPENAHTYGHSHNESLSSLQVPLKYPQTTLEEPRSKSYFAFWSRWSLRRKLLVVGSIITGIIIIAVIIGAAVSLSGSDFDYEESFVKVTNEAAFASGGASRDTPPKNHDGVGAGEDKYVYYSGDATNFPPSSEWVSYQQMWSNNLPTIQGGCSTLGDGEDDTAEQIGYIADAIKNRSSVSYVDHRFILAIILQESQGCVHVGQTTSSGGVSNPGLMQSHNGHHYDDSNSWLSILQMVQDGTQGTEHGAGLVQGLNQFGDPYTAARYYNSGKIGDDLSETDSGTPCYVSDVANRLTGWTRAENLCPDNGA